jgi:hypothetical protein
MLLVQIPSPPLVWTCQKKKKKKNKKKRHGKGDIKKAMARASFIKRQDVSILV